MLHSRQTSLHESFSASLIEEAQLALAKAVYFFDGAMAIVNNAHWKHAWKKIGEFGSNFMTPLYHAMRHGMLDKYTKLVKERVERMVLRNIPTTACTIVSDGWLNVQRRALINIMAILPRGETFFRAVDSFGKIKSGHYIVDVLMQPRSWCA